MLRIRLRRVGKKGNPSYRIVVADSASPRDGKYLEWIGNYDPMANPPAYTLKEDRATRWLGLGAQPSDAVKRILDKAGILDRTPEFRSTTPSSAQETSQPSPTFVSAVVTAVDSQVGQSDEHEAPPDGASDDTLPDETPDDAAAGEESDEAPDDNASAEASEE